MGINYSSTARVEEDPPKPPPLDEENPDQISGDGFGY